MVFKESVVPNLGLLLKMFGVQDIVELRLNFYQLFFFFNSRCFAGNQRGRLKTLWLKNLSCYCWSNSCRGRIFYRAQAHKSAHRSIRGLFISHV